MPSELKNKQSGYTLIELVVVLLLTGILIAAVTPFVATNVEAYMKMRVAKNIAQGARVGLLRMTEELKRATTITRCRSDEIGFRFQPPTGSNRAVTYSEYHGALMRDDGGGDQPMIYPIQSFNLTYYDSNDNTTSTKSYVRRIRIKMDVGPPEFMTSIQTQVTLRNIFTGS